MRSSRNSSKRRFSTQIGARGGLLAVLVLVARGVLQVADALLHLALRLVGDALRLLAAIVGHRADFLACLAGDVLHLALGLILVHQRWLLSRTKLSAKVPSILRACPLNPAAGSSFPTRRGSS